MFSIDTDYSLKNGDFCKWRGFGQTKNPPFSRFYCMNFYLDWHWSYERPKIELSNLLNKKYALNFDLP